MHNAVGTCRSLDLADLLDVGDTAGEIHQMVPHDGPEFVLWTLEHDEAAEVLQCGISEVAERKRYMSVDRCMHVLTSREMCGDAASHEIVSISASRARLGE